MCRHLLLRRQFPDHGEEIARAIRLGQVSGRAGILGLLLVSTERERGDRDDRGEGHCPRPPQGAHGVDARDFRELDVHENQVGPLLEGRGNARFPVHCLEQPVGRASKQIADDLAIQLVVLDVENGLGAHARLACSTRNGIAKEKVEPRPSSLSTQMRPPCISTNFFVMLSPNPVPPNSLAIRGSAWRNSPKTLSSWSLAIPMPVSVTR